MSSFFPFRFAVQRWADRSALTVCAVAAVVGWLLLDDYGIGTDESEQREVALHTVAYATGRSTALLTFNSATYGPAFELALLAGERVLNLQDSRRIHLLRHFLTHLFFLGGGWGCAWLTFRRYRSRGLALCALGLFLLHPRLYAHSFFNSKDLPFLSLFMLALGCLHRAFRKDTLAAFALCGAVVGLLINLRIMGAALFAAVLGLRACDLYYAAHGPARRHILRTGGLFAAASALVLYASWPYLWPAPLERLVAAFRHGAEHPNLSFDVFRGAWLSNEDNPPDYIPTWMTITTPPLALLLAGIGGVTVLRRAGRHPSAALRNTSERFGLLLLACVLLPALAAILLQPNIYDGWRQMYFLYAPLCLLAVDGLQALFSALRRGQRWIYGLTGLGLGATGLAMAGLHPHQYDYFNFLVNRMPSEYLGTQYEMDYWAISPWEALDSLRVRYPGFFYVNADEEIEKNVRLLPAADRQRMPLRNARADFYIHYKPHASAHAIYAPSFARRVYNNPQFTVATLNLSLVDEAAAEPYYAAYRAARAQLPVARTRFDIYLDERTITYIQDPCRLEEMQPRFFLHVTPVDPRALPAAAWLQGFANLDFAFHRRGVRLDDACMAAVPLPAYAIDHIVTGQWIDLENHILRPEALPVFRFKRIPPRPPRAAEHHVLWRARIALPAEPRRNAYRAAYEALATRAPALRSVFDVYVTADAVTYVKAPCRAEDTERKFILHVIPVRLRALAPERRRVGFDNLDFRFEWAGAHFDGKCLARTALPSYAIKRIRVGQFRSGEPPSWEAEISIP